MGYRKLRPGANINKLPVTTDTLPSDCTRLSAIGQIYRLEMGTGVTHQPIATISSRYSLIIIFDMPVIGRLLFFQNGIFSGNWYLTETSTVFPIALHPVVVQAVAQLAFEKPLELSLLLVYHVPVTVILLGSIPMNPTLRTYF